MDEQENMPGRQGSVPQRSDRKFGLKYSVVLERMTPVFLLLLSLLSKPTLPDNPGELYVMAVSKSSPAKPFGTVFQIVDPSRYVRKTRKDTQCTYVTYQPS